MLRAYFDAVALSDELQAHIWHAAELTLQQVRVLRRLARGSMSLGQLGAELHLSPTSVTRLVDRLEERDLVERQRNAPDRRVVNASLTEEGRRLLTSLPVVETSTLYTAVAAMPSEQRAAIVASLRQLVDAVREREDAAARASS